MICSLTETLLFVSSAQMFKSEAGMTGMATKKTNYKTEIEYDVHHVYTTYCVYQRCAHRCLGNKSSGIKKHL